MATVTNQENHMGNRNSMTVVIVLGDGGVFQDVYCDNSSIRLVKVAPCELHNGESVVSEYKGGESLDGLDKVSQKAVDLALRPDVGLIRVRGEGDGKGELTIEFV